MRGLGALGDFCASAEIWDSLRRGELGEYTESLWRGLGELGVVCDNPEKGGSLGCGDVMVSIDSFRSELDELRALCGVGGVRDVLVSMSTVSVFGSHSLYTDSSARAGGMDRFGILFSSCCICGSGRGAAC